MFKYRYVKNAATGEKYWIDKAVLSNEEGPCSEGGDWYEIDLQPVDPDGKTIIGIDLIDYGDEVHITEGLNPSCRARPTEKPGHFEVVTVVARVDGETLEVGSRQPGDGWAPDEYDKPMILRYLWDKYNTLCDAFGSGSQDTGRVRRALDFALKSPAAECRSIVTREMREDLEMYATVDGAAGRNAEFAAFYRRVLGIEEDRSDG